MHSEAGQGRAAAVSLAIQLTLINDFQLCRKVTPPGELHSH